RTRAQMYRGHADWELIRRTKEAVGIAVWGSGDLFTAEAALRMLRETGADAARIARGACGYPWIFRELLALERGETPPEVTLAEWRATILRHVELAIADRRGAYRLQRPEGAPRPRAFRPAGGHAQQEFDAQQAELAATALENPCKAGKASACVELADTYYLGRGTRPDADSAAKAWKRACKLGNQDGCADDALALILGTGQYADPVPALAKLEKMCKQ